EGVLIDVGAAAITGQAMAHAVTVHRRATDGAGKLHDIDNLAIDRREIKKVTAGETGVEFHALIGEFERLPATGGQVQAVEIPLPNHERRRINDREHADPVKGASAGVANLDGIVPRIGHLNVGEIQSSIRLTAHVHSIVLPLKGERADADG